MAWTDFYMDNATPGSNLNSGSSAGDAIYTSTGGQFDGVSVFKPADGSTPASTVASGHYVSLYNTGDAAARSVARVVEVLSGVNGEIKIDTVLKYGTVPASSVSSNRALKDGGAWANLAMLASNSALNNGTVPQSTRINVKAATYANTTTSRAFLMAGTTQLGLWWRGYKTTIGDQDSNNAAIAGTDIPTFTMTTGQFTVTGSYQEFSNIDFTGATVVSNGLFFPSVNFLRIYGCRFTNTASNANSYAYFNNTNGISWIQRCYFKATTTATACVSSGASYNEFIGCVIVGGSIGLTSTSLPVIITHCIFDSQGSDAIKLTSGARIYRCSIYAPIGNGINIATVSGSGVTIIGCYFSTVNQASKAAINNTSGTNTLNIHISGNAYFKCTANITGITETFTVFDIGTLVREAFNNPAAKDFSISDVAQDIGVPGSFENTLIYQGYSDVGAVQAKKPKVYRGRRGT